MMKIYSPILLMTWLWFIFVIFNGYFKVIECCAFGDGCTFPCRCESAECDPLTGDCLTGGCTRVPPFDTNENVGWMGPGCRIGNVALGKSAMQMKTNDHNTAAKAVDGNANSDIQAGHCMYTYDNDRFIAAWWMVDLGKTYIVQEIIIYNSDTLSSSTNDFYIRIGNTLRISHQSLCIHYEDGEKEIFVLKCVSDGMEGRYISMEMRNGSSEYHSLSICEFVVIGYEAIECSYRCTGVCDTLRGCTMCADGYKPPDCKEECDPRTFGPNCYLKCGHCADNTKCKEGSLTCPTGCMKWYTQPRCDVHVERPTLENSNVTVDDLTPYTLNVSWQQDNTITRDLDEYYFYEVHYSATNTTLIVRVNHTVSREMSFFILSNLKENVEYIITIYPHRIWNGTSEAGLPSHAVRHKTLCLGQICKEEKLQNTTAIVVCLGVIICITAIASKAGVLVFYRMKQKPVTLISEETDDRVQNLDQTSFDDIQQIQQYAEIGDLISRHKPAIKQNSTGTDQYIHCGVSDRISETNYDTVPVLAVVLGSETVSGDCQDVDDYIEMANQSPVTNEITESTSRDNYLDMAKGSRVTTTTKDKMGRDNYLDVANGSRVTNTTKDEMDRDNYLDMANGSRVTNTTKDEMVVGDYVQIDSMTPTHCNEMQPMDRSEYTKMDPANYINKERMMSELANKGPPTYVNKDHIRNQPKRRYSGILIQKPDFDILNAVNSGKSVGNSQ